MSSFFRSQLEEWLKTIDVKADSLLDVGGSANPVSKRVKSFDVKEYKILDNNNEKEWHDKWRKPDYVYDLNEKIKLNEKFDVIFCLEVAEYLFNPLMAIRNMYSLLNKGGILYMSFPFIYCQHNPLAADCLRYTPIGVETLFAKSGFLIEEHVLRRSQGGLVEWYSGEGMRMAKTADHNTIGSLTKTVAV